MGEHGLIVNHLKIGRKRTVGPIDDFFLSPHSGDFGPEDIFDRAIELKNELKETKALQSGEK